MRDICTSKSCQGNAYTHGSLSADEFATIVTALCDDETPRWPTRRSVCAKPLPSREVVVNMMGLLRSILFPGYFGNSELHSESLSYQLGNTLDQVQRTLLEQTRRSLCFVCEKEPALHCSECEDRSRQITSTLLKVLPELRYLLSTDVRAAFEGDPAATSPEETIFCYPGLLAITNHRVAHVLNEAGANLLARMISEDAHSTTGIDIHPGATIDESFFIDHGTGVVIGETANIGKRVRIYQGVTLGAKSFPLDESGKPMKGIPRHPIVQDDVTIYAGATVLGRITIGRGSVIGGNVWLTRSVPPETHVSQATLKKEQFEDGAGI